MLTPSAEIISLIENGMPCNGPQSTPRLISFSIISASLYARSFITVMKEFKHGLNLLILFMQTSTKSTEDSS